MNATVIRNVVIATEAAAVIAIVSTFRNTETLMDAHGRLNRAALELHAKDQNLGSLNIADLKVIQGTAIMNTLVLLFATVAVLGSFSLNVYTLIRRSKHDPSSPEGTTGHPPATGQKDERLSENAN
jgi:hypothetical protein